MITLGLSYDKILDHVRETSGMYCASLLEKKDIENIANEFGLKQDTQRHPDDNTSVRLIAQELKDAAELLYYKDQGVMDQEYRNIHEKEFVLGFMTKAQEIIFSNHLKITENIQVCMDSTHSMSQYSGYQLTTLMTVTDLNEGFPVAFLISSTVNTNIVKAFLDKVKNRMGTIRAHIFMSADDPLFRKAWEASMSGETVPFYLNCFWHTDRTFRKSIASKIQAPTTEKAVIYQMLRALMDEPEEDVFQEECKSFLKYLLEAGFNAFHNYFTLNYLDEKRIKLWPKCFHNNVTFHTNNHLENMHRVVKYIYLRGKKAKRLDCTILTLEKMVNDKLYKRIIDLMRNRTVGRYKYHFSECQKQGRDLKVDQREHGVFYVYSASNKNKQYEVKTCGLPCETCRERCPYCHVCKCMYVCSCEDSGEGQKNICKHIHAVIQFRKDKCLPANSKDPTNEIEMIQEEVCINTSSSESLVREWQQKILSKISLNLVPKCKDLKDLQILKSVDDLITKTIAVMDAAARCPASTCKLPVDVDTSKEPSNEAFAKQDRLDSTRKKRKNTDEGTSFVKPSIKARHMIDDSLLKEDEVRTPVLSKGDVQQEHCYC